MSAAAKRLGVGVPRIHQRIADGSLRAERIGSQWVVEERSLAPVSESSKPGRRLSERSAWALLAVSQGNEHDLSSLAPAERSRAKERLRRLLAQSTFDDGLSESQVRDVAIQLRAWLRSRAGRRLFRASPRDLPELRDDSRLALSGLSHGRSGIASGDFVEAYVHVADVEALAEDYLLSADARDANVVLHVLSPQSPEAIDYAAPLLLAADLVEHRGPREEARGVELVRDIAKQHPQHVVEGAKARSTKRKAPA